MTTRIQSLHNSPRRLCWAAEFLAFGVAAVAMASAAAAENVPVGVGGGAGSVFTPPNITILVGDTVTWTNLGGFHNVSSDTPLFRCANGCDQTGGNGNAATAPWAATFRFNADGFRPYHCEIHGGFGMTGSVKVLRSIFADGFEGGASDDQWAALTPLAGDYCATAVDVPSDVGGLASTLAGAQNDSDLTFDASCLSAAAHGRDRAFKLTVASGNQVTATATPVGAALDLAVYLIPSAQCDLLAPLVCLDGADDGVGGQPETVTYTNSTVTSQEVYLFVDSLSAASAGGAFTLTVSYITF